MTVKMKMKDIVEDVCKNIHDHTARAEMNKLMRTKLHNFNKSKDIRGIRGVINQIPNNIMKQKMLDYICEKLPFEIDAKINCLTVDKERLQYFTPQLIDRFNVMDAVLTKKVISDVFQIDCKSIAADEFLSFAADSFILLRHQFSKEQIDSMIDLLNTINNRKTE